MKNDTEKLVIKKPNQTIMISNGKITVTQRKAYNVLLHKASQELKNDVSKSEFCIAIADIKRMAGINATDNWHLKNDLKALKKIDIEIVKNNGNWTAFNLLSQVEKDGDFLKYEFPKIIREALIQNNYYTTLDLMIIKTLTCKYAVILYEAAMRYNKVEIPKFQIDEFKKLTGTEKYKNFNDLKRWAIEPAIEEINEKTDIEMSCEIFKTGRKVTEIKFGLINKPHMNLFEDSQIPEKPEEHNTESEKELISLKISRKQAEAAVKKYPEEQIKRNIELTKKKSADGEIKNIPAFLTEAIREDYAKDYNPVNESYKDAISEAKTCWQRNMGHCGAVWNNHRDKKTSACHWCRKFADFRKESL